MHEDQVEALKAIAAMAADAIVRETQDANDHWVIALRKYDPHVSPPPPKVTLHGLLRAAADAFYKTSPKLAKTLEVHRSTVDSMRS